MKRNGGRARGERKFLLSTVSPRPRTRTSACQLCVCGVGLFFPRLLVRSRPDRSRLAHGHDRHRQYFDMFLFSQPKAREEGKSREGRTERAGGESGDGEESSEGGGGDEVDAVDPRRKKSDPD